LNEEKKKKKNGNAAAWQVKTSTRQGHGLWLLI